jgi:(E)-4-hydroxy-3-methylbut-2-enyl-diphosphate synthase
MVGKYLNNVNKPLKIAVMGCVVNGPGEARDADAGIACGKGRGALFRKGRVIRTVDESEFFQSLTEEIESLVK